MRNSWNVCAPEEYARPMKYLLLVLIFLPISAHAFTRATFPGVVGMISLTDRVGGQVTDDDPRRLYDLMNVEPKQEFMGTGKTIKLEDKSLTMLCVDRSGQVTCTVIVKAGGRGTVSKAKNLIRFETEGEEAKLLHSMLHLDASGKFSYQTTDAYFRIESDGVRFLAEYSTGN